MKASSTTFNQSYRPVSIQACIRDENDCAIHCTGRKVFDQHDNIIIL